MVTYCSSDTRLYRYDILEDNFTDFGSVLPTRNFASAGFYSQYDATILYTVNFAGDSLYIFDMSSVDPVQQRINTTIPVDVSYHGCLASSELTGAVYVIGGNGHLKIVQIYDINSSTWSNGTSLNYGRAWHDCIVEPTTQILYVVGDWWNKPIERNHVNNIRNQSWEEFAEYPSEATGTRVRLAVWYNIIFIIGGEYADPGTDEVYIIDTVCNMYRTHQYCIQQKCMRHDQGLYLTKNL